MYRVVPNTWSGKEGRMFSECFESIVRFPSPSLEFRSVTSNIRSMETCFSPIKQISIPGQQKHRCTTCLDIHFLRLLVDSACGYSTPPRLNSIGTQRSPVSALTRRCPQPKLLTSAELKQRFSPIKKRRRRHLVELQVNERTDSCVPLKRPRHMPVLMPKLFADEQRDSLSGSVWPKQVYPHLVFDSLKTNSLKNPEEKPFTISENILMEKFQTLIEKSS